MYFQLLKSRHYHKTFPSIRLYQGILKPEPQFYLALCIVIINITKFLILLTKPES